MNVRRSGFDWAMEGLALTALVVICVLVAHHWDDLPDRVPIHFGIAGDANSWGAKNNIWFLPLVHFGIYILLTLASRYQRLVNIPFAVDRKSPDVQKTILSMTISMKAVLMVLGVYMVSAAARTAEGQTSGLGVWFLPVFLVAVTGTLGVFLARLRRLQS